MSYRSETIATTVNRLNAQYFLPAIQREFVWRPAQIVQLFDSIMRGWQNYLKNTFHLTSYKKLRAERFDEAIQFLNQQRGRSLPKLRRTNNDEWRNRIYRAIWPLAHELGMSHGQVYDFAFTELGLKKPITSLKELGQQNLEALRNKLRYLKRKLG
jgi:hypothetical protein